jgi:SAM-dependent methyltransferase
MKEALKRRLRAVLPRPRYTASRLHALVWSRAPRAGRSSMRDASRTGSLPSSCPSFRSATRPSRLTSTTRPRCGCAASSAVDRSHASSRRPTTHPRARLPRRDGQRDPGPRRRATAIDLSLEHVDPRARARGVQLVAANAERLPFDEGQFDCVFSYNAFEHFGDPRAVLAEALRVVRPTGALYFLFGPLYRAAYGLHAFHAITVPFCHYRWERSVLAGHVAREGLGRIDLETLNEWTLQQFRDLWAEWQPWAQRIAYREIPELRGMELVRAHPSCFRDQADRFEDLLVAVLEVGLRRTVRPLESAGPSRRQAPHPTTT